MILGVVVLGGGVFLYEKIFTKSSHVPGANSAPAQGIVFGSPLSGTLYTLTSSGNTAPYTLPGISTAIQEIVGDATTSYILVPAADGTNSSLVAWIHAGAKPLQQIVPTSPSFKAHLSYDPASHMVTYAVVTEKPLAFPTSKVVLYNPFARTETTLFDGAQPYLLPGGQYVVYQASSSIELAATQKGSIPTMLIQDDPFRSVFAVDPASETLAVYIPRTHTIDYYDIHFKDSIKYLKSESIPDSLVPTAIAFEHGSVYIAGPRDTAFTTSFFMEVGQKTYTTITNPKKNTQPEGLFMIAPQK